MTSYVAMVTKISVSGTTWCSRRSKLNSIYENIRGPNPALILAKQNKKSKTKKNKKKISLAKCKKNPQSFDCLNNSLRLAKLYKGATNN